MEFQCQLTHAEMREALRMNRTQAFWFKAALANLRALILIGVVLVVGAAKIVQGDSGNWAPMFALTGFALVLIAVYVWRQRNAIRKSTSQLNAICSEMSLNAQGVSQASVLGATSFTPWAQFPRWKEGKLVFTIGDAKNFRTVPKSALTESQMQELRGMLQTQIR